MKKAGNLKQESGQILILAIIVTGLVLVNSLMIIAGSQTFFNNSKYTIQSSQAVNLAEAGIDKAIASLDKTGGTYLGEAETKFGDGSFSVIITTPDQNTKIIESTGYIPSKSEPKTKKTIRITASKGQGTSFNYGLQIGEGGLTMANESRVNGSVYSNGNIRMNNGAVITGDAYVAGGIQPNPNQTSDCTSLGSCLVFDFGKNIGGNDRLDIAQSFKLTTNSPINKVALNLKKYGFPSDITVRLMKDNGNKPDKNNVLTTGTLTANRVSSQYGFIDVTFNSSPYLLADNTYWIVLDTSSNSSNYWSWSADSVQSYTRGEAKWSPNWQASNPVWNTTVVDLDFKVYLGGGATFIEGSSGVVIGGDAHANTLEDLTVSKGAYYQVKEDVTAASYHPGSSDPPATVMPISESNIDDWKKAAQDQGVFTGDRTICAGTLGPGKYTGNISSINGCTVIVTSPVWITGTLSLANNVVFKLDSNAPASGVIVVNGLTSLSNNAKILGNGSPGNYLMLLSLFDSRSTGTNAVSVANGGNDGILYAPYGIVSVSNNNRLNELVAWKVDLGNGVVINYDTGLSSIFFNSGPSGSYSIVGGTYQLK